MADKFLRCEVVGSIANSITVKPYVDGAGIITVYQQDNILFDPDTLRAEGAEEMRQAALDALEEQLDYLQMLNKDENPEAESKWYGVNWARNTIADLPSAQPVRKTEKWIEGGIYRELIECNCSECGQLMTTVATVRMNYCPNCGAKMTISTK